MISLIEIENLLLGIILHPELKPLYTRASLRVKKWLKNLHLFFVIVVPAISTVPSLLSSFHAYYTDTDLGSAAFEFLYPMW